MIGIKKRASTEKKLTYFKWVMKMKNSKEMLASVLKTSQMGQVGIRSVMPYAVRSELKKELKSQLQEYDSIEREACAIASARGWELSGIDPMAKAMSMAYARMNLMFGNVDSKIAAMMIQGNTRGMIKSLKNQHHSKQEDSRIALLTQKLLDCETENVRQMQGYV